MGFGSLGLQDMEPKEIKQTKVFVATEQEQKNSVDLSRLNANIPIRVNNLHFICRPFLYWEMFLKTFQNELEDWDDEAQEGWHELDDGEDIKKILREKRKEMRKQKRWKRYLQNLVLWPSLLLSMWMNVTW